MKILSFTCFLVFVVSIFISCSGLAQIQYGSNPAAGKVVKVNGIDVYYEAYGIGEPLILLHGNSQSIVDWQYQIPELAKYYHVIVPDSRAQGNSGDDDRELTYDLLADDVVAFMDHLSIKSADVVGWSDGGNTGLSMALRHRDKLKTLITVGANYRVDSTAIGSDVIGLLKSNLAAEKNDEQKKLLRLMLYYPNLTTADLATITTRVVVMAGEFDVILPGHTQELASAIPRSQLVIVKEAGHFIPNEKPDEFNRLVLKLLGTTTRENLAGTVHDSKSADPIPYVTVYLGKTMRGTMTDLSGNFEIEPPEDDDSLRFSAVGYQTKTILASNLDKQGNIVLRAKDYLLDEVVISAKAQTAEGIMKRAIRNLEKNYPQDAYGFTMYVDQRWKKSKNDSTSHCQAIVQGYNKSGYGRRVHAYFLLMTKFYFNMVEQRRQNITDSSRVIPYQTGILYSDVIRFSNNPVNKNNLKNFDFKLENVLETDQDTIYVISFRCKDPNYWNTAEPYSTEYLGTIQINSSDYAIVSYSASNIADRDILKTRKKKLRYLPENLQSHFEAHYVKIGAVYFPSTIKTVSFTYKGDEKKPISYFQSETIVYDLTLKNPIPIEPPKNYRVPATRNVAFNAKFWRKFSVPRPIGTN